MEVLIGADPHKATNAVAAVDGKGRWSDRRRAASSIGYCWRIPNEAFGHRLRVVLEPESTEFCPQLSVLDEFANSISIGAKTHGKPRLSGSL